MKVGGFEAIQGGANIQVALSVSIAKNTNCTYDEKASAEGLLPANIFIEDDLPRMQFFS
jgi:hypothetical protein